MRGGEGIQPGQRLGIQPDGDQPDAFLSLARLVARLAGVGHNWPLIMVNRIGLFILLSGESTPVKDTWDVG